MQQVARFWDGSKRVSSSFAFARWLPYRYKWGDQTLANQYRGEGMTFGLPRKRSRTVPWVAVSTRWESGQFTYFPINNTTLPSLFLDLPTISWMAPSHPNNALIDLSSSISWSYLVQLHYDIAMPSQTAWLAILVSFAYFFLLHFSLFWFPHLSKTNSARGGVFQ